MVQTCDPSTTEAETRRLQIGAHPGLQRRPCLKAVHGKLKQEGHLTHILGDDVPASGEAQIKSPEEAGLRRKLNVFTVDEHLFIIHDLKGI